MILGAYAVYDKLTGYMTPNFQANDNFAIRTFDYELKSSEMSLISAKPEDFSLCRIGTYDTDTGVLHAEPIVILVDAGQLLRKE